MFQGIGASPGIAIGKALVYKRNTLNIEKSTIEDVEKEKIRLKNSIDQVILQLENIKVETEKKLGSEKAAIFEAHKMILEDPEFISQVNDKIEMEKVNADYAASEVIHTFVAIFENMDDEYMRERVADIKDVGRKLLKNMLGIEDISLTSLSEKIILVADDLTPSDTAILDKEMVLGLMSSTGGKTSHAAILARSLGIPAIVGLNHITEQVKNGDLIVFDGESGLGYIHPNKNELDLFSKKKKAYEDERSELLQLKNCATISLDGRKVELAANISTPKDIEGVLDNGAEGIGLYRTEFLYMNRNRMPSEEEQFEVYKEVLEKMAGKPVIIRTLDIGGDKEVPYLNLPQEMNPFLGYRAIRICLDRPEIFKPQLRALLRASVYGNLKIMFPMISSVEEIRGTKSILEEVRKELEEEGISYKKSIDIGIMIEIPAAAIIGDLLIKEVDFFSIGTNDLMQYTIAVDRMNEKISNLYNPFHPAILRMIKIIIDHAHKEGKWVGMCGEMAGDSRIIPTLLGLGLDEFSMSASAILPARKMIQNLSYEDMSKIAEKALTFSTAEEIKNYIDQQLGRKL